MIVHIKKLNQLDRNYLNYSYSLYKIDLTLFISNDFCEDYMDGVASSSDIKKYKCEPVVHMKMLVPSHCDFFKNVP